MSETTLVLVNNLLWVIWKCRLLFPFVRILLSFKQSIVARPNFRKLSPKEKCLFCFYSPVFFYSGCGNYSAIIIFLYVTIENFRSVIIDIMHCHHPIILKTTVKRMRWFGLAPRDLHKLAQTQYLLSLNYEIAQIKRVHLPV